MKYNHWQVASYTAEDQGALRNAGYGPLVSRVLCARGYISPTSAALFVAGVPSRDPFILRDMEIAVARIRRALRENEHMAVYGDYDVDGMTSIAILERYLREQGGQVRHYVPDRLEEGYGLNADALRRLRESGVTLVITVDAGITAVAETEEARALGLDLIITDHHQCRETLPAAHAVVNPCRTDCAYPFPHLAGVGVAFKLVCAMAGPERYRALLSRFGDLVAFGTVADVMPLIDENRSLVRNGLISLSHTRNAGLKALIEEADLKDKRLTASTLSYILAPRVNAAGRLGKTELAVELLLTDDPARARVLAAELCSLNRYRQTVENEIFHEALSMLEEQADDPVIVLAREDWHSGVVGIVASRLVERFGKPTYLICLEDGAGKGSARGAGGVSLVDTLAQAGDLLSNYGGHEKAAGFSLPAQNIEAFRERICAYVAPLEISRYEETLSADAVVPPSLFTKENVLELQTLEPFGAGNPSPVFILGDVGLERVTPVGGGRHLKLVLRAEGLVFQGIYFGMDPLSLGCAEGDRVDIAFHAEINTFLNQSQVQFQLCDIRISSPVREIEERSLSLYRRFTTRDSDDPLSSSERNELTPDRSRQAAVWRYIKRVADNEPLAAHISALSRDIARAAGLSLTPGQLLVILDIFEDCNLLAQSRSGAQITINPAAAPAKADLETSETMGRLIRNR